MKHIVEGIKETLKEFENKSATVLCHDSLRLQTATEIFNYVLSELEINAEALRDSERRSISKEPYK